MESLREYVISQAKDKKRTPREWLEDKVKFAAKCKFATHLSKLSHTSADGSICINVDRSSKTLDIKCPYVISNSVKSAFQDVAINSGTDIPAAKILTKIAEEGRMIYEHLLDDTKYIREELTSLGVVYEDIRSKLLACEYSPKPTKTDILLKQIYFPYGDNYHLLTVLPSSVLLTEIKDRIKKMRDQKERVYNEKSPSYGGTSQCFSIPKIIFTKIGGNNAQNAGFLNSNNSGGYYLLPSLPPKLGKGYLRRPNEDFFTEVLGVKKFRKDFIKLGAKYTRLDKQSNYENKQAVKEVEEDILYRVIAAAIQMQDLAAGWSDDKELLPLAQKHWLDSGYEAMLNDEDLEEIAEAAASWFVYAYEKSQSSRAGKSMLADENFRKIKRKMTEILKLSNV